jgi:phosphoglycerate dehydrogenase-like enzyme
VKVAILDDIHHASEGTPGVGRLRERADVRIFTGPFGNPEALAGFDAVVANRERTMFTRDLLERLPDLRLIVQTGNHAYHIDLAAAEGRGVIVAKATGGFSYGAAELAIGLALSLMRQIPASHDGVKRGAWPMPCTQVLHRKTLGIVGLGHVGGHVAKIANAFEMRVLAWGPRLTDESARMAGAERCDLDDLLRLSDVVSIHATLGPESHGLIDSRRIALMKPTAVLINTARGPVVREESLVAALRDQRIAGAGLDVFDQEPLPAGHPFTMLPNVVLTPHIGWPTDEAYERFADAAADVLLAYLDGREVARFRS